MTNIEDFDEDKKNSGRRQKFTSKKKHNKKDMLDDEIISRNYEKKHIKKIKESFSDEEWEDWDKYYNR
jgi:hypothetical protein